MKNIPSLWAGAIALLGAIVGGVSTSAPGEAQRVIVNPGDDIGILVQRHPPGTEFRIKAGVYRLQSLSPKDGDSIIGEPGAVLNGAQLMTGFSPSGPLWVATVSVKRRSKYVGECIDSHPACVYPEDLFIDNAPLTRVADVGQVLPGTWCLDYAAGAAYLGDDPAGHTVEMSLSPNAINGSAANVRIENLTMEKYACPAQAGALDGTNGRNWVVENNVVQLNHCIGIRLGDGMQVLRNKLLRNGELGVGGMGSNEVVDGNEIAFNNYAGYDYRWEGGGAEFAFNKNIVVRNNYSHDNDGPGLWTDIESENALYEHNHTKSNREAGILHEISYHAVIRYNNIEDEGVNDFHKSGAWWGAGIIVAAASNVEIYGNTVTNCLSGIVGLQAERGHSSRGMPFLLQDLNVHDNVITQSQGTAAGILSWRQMGEAIFDSRNNRFTNNQYHFAESDGKYFAWKGRQLSYTEWKVELHQNGPSPVPGQQ